MPVSYVSNTSIPLSRYLSIILYYRGINRMQKDAAALFSRLAQINRKQLPLMETFESQARPAFGPAWMRSIPFVGETQTSEAHYSRLPHGPGAGIVNALVGVAALIFQVHQRAHHEQLVGGIYQAEFAGQDHMQRGGQR